MTAEGKELRAHPRHILAAQAGSPGVWRDLMLSPPGGLIHDKKGGSRGQPKPPSTPAFLWEAPSTLSKALSLQPVTTDRVVSHCNSRIWCRNNFSTVKSQQMFEANSEGRLPERCVFVVIIWICFVGNMKDVVRAGRRQLSWKLLLLFFFFLLQ